MLGTGFSPRIFKSQYADTGLEINEVIEQVRFLNCTKILLKGRENARIGLRKRVMHLSIETPTPPPHPGEVWGISLGVGKKNVIMPYIHGPCFLSKPQVKRKNSPTPGTNHVNLIDNELEY